MELHCLPTESRPASSQGSLDQLYDNCPPYTLLRRGRGGRAGGLRGYGYGYGESGGGAAAAAAVRLVPAGGLPAHAPRGPQSGLAPAMAHVPTLPPAAAAAAAAGGLGGSGSSGRTGAWPDHNYCSWGQSSAAGRQGWGAEARWRNNGAVGEGPGGGGAGKGRGGGKGGGAAFRERAEESPGLHQSALSLYDNLHEVSAPGNDKRVATPMETSFLYDDEDEDEDDDRFLFLCGGEEKKGEEVHLLAAMESSVGGVSRDSSVWSSCEIILAESRCSEGPGDRASEGAAAASSSLPDSGTQTGVLPAEWRDPSPDEVPPPPRGATRLPPLPPPLPVADPGASALRSILTGLQHQMGRQREEYEARITSLEQRNEELEGQLAGLRANLSQQRRWYQAVQARIRESERARAAAEVRNASIQREMDQVLDTFGELNNEAQKAERIVRSF